MLTNFAPYRQLLCFTVNQTLVDEKYICDFIFVDADKNIDVNV